MKVEQLSVFLENKSGRLSQVTAILYESDINILALTLLDTSEFGVMRLIVDNATLAFQVLKDSGFTVSKTEVVAVQVEDHPGGLHKLLNILKQADINVEYMYDYLRHIGRDAILIFRKCVFLNAIFFIIKRIMTGMKILSRSPGAVLIIVRCAPFPRTWGRGYVFGL